MEKQIKLPEFDNQIIVEGILKSNTLQEYTSRKGEKYIKGKLTVLVENGKDENGNSVSNEVVFDVFRGENHGLFQNTVTMMNEYKGIDDVGFDEADRVELQGSVYYNEFRNKDGQIVRYNNISLFLSNRLTGVEREGLNPRAVGELDLLVEGFEPIMNKDGLPTGDYKVLGKTIGYNNRIIPLFDLVVSKELYGDMSSIYQPNSVAKVYIKVNHSVTLVEPEETIEQQPSVAFGKKPDIEPKVIMNRDFNFEVISGDLPYMVGNAKSLNEEQIAEVKKLRELDIAKLDAPRPTPTPQRERKGFGADNPLGGLSGGGIPDF